MMLTLKELIPRDGPYLENKFFTCHVQKIMKIMQLQQSAQAILCAISERIRWKGIPTLQPNRVIDKQAKSFCL